MASAVATKLCSKCKKGGVATCDGCQHSFCLTHLNEHRQELGLQMDQLTQEYDRLRWDLCQDTPQHSLLSRINKWERESITKIQITAEIARTELQQLIDQAKDEFNTPINKITDGLLSSRISDDYTETSLNKWVEQLNKLRKKLDASPPTINIVYDERPSATIRLIKVIDQQQLSSHIPADLLFKDSDSIPQELIPYACERFDQTVGGHITLSEENLVATFSRYSRFFSDICGVSRYSSGKHDIRLQIDQKGPHDLVFGIMTSTQEITNNLPPSLYGWWDLDAPIVRGSGQKQTYARSIESGDKIVFRLDCDNQQIQLQHCRLERCVHLPIDLLICPLPWKFLVGMYSEGDCVRILT